VRHSDVDDNEEELAKAMDKLQLSESEESSTSSDDTSSASAGKAGTNAEADVAANAVVVET
jgi:hypothetical protein